MLLGIGVMKEGGGVLLVLLKRVGGGVLLGSVKEGRRGSAIRFR